MKEYMRLYLVLESGMLRVPLEEFVPAVIDGGVTCIQLRDKSFTSRERFRTGELLRKLLSGTGVPLVVNDRADIAAAIGADTVHVGPKDVPLAVLKKSFTDMRFGYSCNCADDIAAAADADYIGVGPAFFTDTKADLRGLLGPEGIKALMDAADKPAVAIGGINSENILRLKGSGISGVAVSSAICAASDPFAAAKELRAKAEEL